MQQLPNNMRIASRISGEQSCQTQHNDSLTTAIQIVHHFNTTSEYHLVSYTYNIADVILAVLG